MVREIVFYPDPLLYDVSREVTVDEITSETGQTLAKDLIDTVAYTRGAAVAGVQVGVKWRVMAIGAKVYWNPKVVGECRCKEEVDEGCLSVPGVLEKVWRNHTIDLQFLDSAGQPQEARLEGLEAQAALHEIEHMDGKLLTSSLSPAKLAHVATRMKQLRRAAKGYGTTLTRLVYGQQK